MLLPGAEHPLLAAAEAGDAGLSPGHESPFRSGRTAFRQQHHGQHTAALHGLDLHVAGNGFTLCGRSHQSFAVHVERW